MKKSLAGEILEILDGATKPLSINQITKKSTITRHDSRVGLALDNLRKNGDVVLTETGLSSIHGYCRIGSEAYKKHKLF